MNDPEEKREQDGGEQVEECVAESSAHEQEPASEEGEQRPADTGSAEDVPSPQVHGSLEADAAVLAASRGYTRRAFVVAGVASAAAAYGFHREINTAPENEMQPNLLRYSFRADAAVSRGVFRDAALAPTYPLSRAETLRINGVLGLKQVLDAENWRLQVVGVRNAVQHPRYARDVTAWQYRYTGAKSLEDQGHDTKVDPKMASSMKMAPAPMQDRAVHDEIETGRAPRGVEEAGRSDSTLPPSTPGLLLTMDDILELPRHELVTQFKCIEGWSQIVHWTGVRMADFLARYAPAPIDGKEPRYVYMETPDGNYYNGYDLAVLRHPQALLVTEMMGAPLTQFHGAPLRLHLPMKYGYKQIKRIGLVSYTNNKPDDYWTRLGYDWYAGL